jgi:glucose/arabinose dehydrogenase
MNARRALTSVLLLVLACASDDAEARQGKRKAKTTSPPAAAASAATPSTAAAAAIAAPAAVAADLQLTVVARKLARPVDLDAAPGDTTGRLFVVEQVGRIRILRNGVVAETPFLDIAARVSRSNEQGLLGLAFHPDYAKNGRFFINYTDRNGDSHVTEYKVDAKNPDRADPASERDLFTVEQPYSNHNGGHVLFGPDGFLWVGFGDGGAANDPHGNGQKDGTLLGKMLRVDVNASTPKPIVHWKGLRNPWRYAFDPKTGDLFIGDVGQDKYEEIDVVDAADVPRAGLNFGWNRVEGVHCFRRGECDTRGLVAPVVEYAHDEAGGCSVTGGVVYRGKALPALDGVYFYADYCTGLLRSFRWKAGAPVDHWDWKAALDPKRKLATLSAFGTDADGEIYLLSLDGIVYKLERKP